MSHISGNVSKIIRCNKIYIAENDIANQFNQHFASVGPTLANSTRGANDINPSTYISNSPIPSFVMPPVTEKQEYNLFLL